MKPGDKGSGRASAEYQTAFWNAMRKKNYYDVNNALSIGEDAEGGYLVPDEFERNLVEVIPILYSYSLPSLWL